MACGYLRHGLADHEAVFHLFFRKHPFGGGYTIACGLEYALDVLERFRFDAAACDYLGGLTDPDGEPLLPPDFLQYLQGLRLTVDVAAVPEGTAVFPHEPLVRVQGPLIEAQLLESVLLNLINFQTLIATKAARICQAADGPVLEFGLRRAQGMDGALAVARAAYVGGCAGTSNVLAAKLFDLPAKGTHAHSWVMAFESEQEAFAAYADALPNNTIFLVDTYNTLDGVRRAIEVGKRLRAAGRSLQGVRLDSGDLAYLSRQTRRLLDDAGFGEAKIVASGDLDEHVIQSLRQQDARIDIWGVGTRLVTAHDDPALGGVYKLAAIRAPGGAWQDKVKLSEQLVKMSVPGVQQIRRFARDGQYEADMVYDLRHEPTSLTIVDPADATRRKRLRPDDTWEDLLVPVLRAGEPVDAPAGLTAARQRCRRELSRLHDGVKRFVNPHAYPAGLERNLFDHRHALIMALRAADEDE